MLESRARGKGAKIVISNTYAEGKAVDTSRFYERFYRQDESHNSEKSGFGIASVPSAGLMIFEYRINQFPAERIGVSEGFAGTNRFGASSSPPCPVIHP